MNLYPWKGCLGVTYPSLNIPGKDWGQGDIRGYSRAIQMSMNLRAKNARLRIRTRPEGGPGSVYGANVRQLFLRLHMQGPPLKWQASLAA